MQFSGFARVMGSDACGFLVLSILNLIIIIFYSSEIISGYSFKRLSRKHECSLEYLVFMVVYKSRN